MISDLEIGWLAGILEGEGCFLMRSRHKNSQSVNIESTDEDVINKVALIVERLTGKLYNVGFREPQTGFLNAKERYTLQVNGEPARIVMRTIVRYMCSRRRQRIWQCLNGYRSPKKLSREELFQALKLVS